MASPKKPLVVVTRRLPDSVEMRMRELFDARLNSDDKPLSPAELIQAVKTADVIVPTVTDHIDKSVLSQSGEKLKLIANFGNGVDNIDVATAVQRGITVTNTPGVLTEDTADMTMALILAVPRRLAEGAQVLTSDREWTGWSPTWMLGHRIWGKRLGIVGLGRIGQAVARRAQAFGLKIHYHDRRRVAAEIEEELHATYWESLDQMLARMDIISVNCPHTPATYHLLSANWRAPVKSYCCRIWRRPRSKAASTWAKRSSSTSRRFSTVIVRPIVSCHPCCERPILEFRCQSERCRI
jgi:glyoxylate reductase